MHHIETNKIYQCATVDDMLALAINVGDVAFVATDPKRIYVKCVENKPESIRDFSIFGGSQNISVTVRDPNERFKLKVHEAQQQHEQEMTAALAKGRSVANSAADAIHLFATKGIEVRNREFFANRKYVAGVDPYGNPEHGSSEWFRDKVKEAQEQAEAEKFFSRLSRKVDELFWRALDFFCIHLSNIIFRDRK